MDHSATPDTTARDLEQAQRTLRQAAVDLGWLRLLHDVAGPDSGPRVREIAAHQLGAQLRGVARVVTTGLAVLAVTLGIVAAAPAGDAQAATIPLERPVRVTISGPTAVLATQVAATAPTTARGAGRFIAVSAPLYGGAQVRVGTFAAPGTVVPVRVAEPSRAFVLGRSTWMTRDLGDGRLTPMPVDARQASRILAASVVAQGGGVADATVWVNHYSAARGAWVSSAYAPVQVQAWLGDGWVTVANLTTDANGWAGGPVPAAGDVLRFVRPDGAQVWGSSAVRSVES